MHWNYTNGSVPTESDQPMNAYTTGSWDGVRRACRRGVLADRVGHPGEGTRTARKAQRATGTAVSVAGGPLRGTVSRQWVHLGHHGQPLHPDSGRSTLDLCRAPRIGAATARRDPVHSGVRR